MLAVPTGLIGVILTLVLTGTTLNIQSLMGIVMLQGMVVSNSILIVDFANVLRSEGRGLKEAVVHACRIRLRPILMTSLATVVGLLPMAFNVEPGSEAYAPLARAIIGGLISSILLTIFVVPAAYLLMYRHRARRDLRPMRAVRSGLEISMPSFSLRHPYFIVVVCLFVCVLGFSSLLQMPVDMFPAINIPVVMVATFYSGMPPQQIEADITDTFERFFTLGSGIDHMESRSMSGVSLIKIYFQPGTDANADVTQISNLAMADLRRLPQGTLPPVVMSMDASSLPVCLLTVEGQGMSETQLHDYLQFQIRNQIAGVPGATVPPPYGGRYRQIMVYVDPLKLQANQLSPMDVVRATDESNLILPAGDVRIGPTDYNLYTNAQVPDAGALNTVPLKTEGENSVFVSDVGKAVDGSALQYNIVRVNGQRSVYVPILKQGGDTNTIEVVNGIEGAIKNLRDIPSQLKTHVVFDQSLFVKQAISTVLREGGIGLLLTGLMILIFLGSPRATAAVFLSIPLSVMAAFFLLHSGDETINSMVLSGLALAFSRLIDNSVIVLENIFRHIELGENPTVASERGANEVSLAVLAITLVTVVVFFPVTFLFGVSKYLFTALALAVVISLFASYFVAVSVVPLYCAHVLRGIVHHAEGSEKFRRTNLGE